MRLHLALTADEHGVPLAWSTNDDACCAERRVLLAHPSPSAETEDDANLLPPPHFLVVVRAHATAVGVSIRGSRPCGKCRSALADASRPTFRASSLRVVAWSTDVPGEFSWCAPCDVPENAYVARNGAW